MFALAFAVGGVLVAGGPRRVRRRAPQPGTARRRVVGVLFGLAALPAALAMGVAVDRHAALSDLGLAWIVIASLRRVPATQLGLVVGTGVALVGAQLPLGTEGTVPWAYLLTFGLALGSFLGYRWQRSVVLLAPSGVRWFCSWPALFSSRRAPSGWVSATGAPGPPVPAV